MTAEYHVSKPLRSLLQQAEDLLDVKIVLKRQKDAPSAGYVVDSFLQGSDQNIILFPEDALGMLKDFIIAKHTTKLILQGVLYREGRGRVLTYDQGSVTRGIHQIYLDFLKDEKTRGLPLATRKAVIPEIFFMFHQRLMELPWIIPAQLFVSRNCPALRTPQMYSLVRESLIDMYSLDRVKEEIPLRYIVMHQGMYYARDMLLAYKLSANELHPEINIPDLQAFRSLDATRMMEYRWSQSPWVHTKIVGEAMANLMNIELLAVNLDQVPDYSFFKELSASVLSATQRWLIMMNMQDWFVWDSPGSYRNAHTSRERILEVAAREVFSE